MIASPSSPQKDRIAAEFSLHNLPKEQAGSNNFILHLDEIDLTNFVILEPAYFD
jgi:hypothetical protein